MVVLKDDIKSFHSSMKSRGPDIWKCLIIYAIESVSEWTFLSLDKYISKLIWGMS